MYKIRICKSQKLDTCFLYDNSSTHSFQRKYLQAIHITYTPHNCSPMSYSSYSAFCISFTIPVPWKAALVRVIFTTLQSLHNL